MCKVLGANLVDVIRLFLKEYLGLILLSNLIAWPLAYGVTDKWLEICAYRLTQDIIPYAWVCVFILMTAFVLVGAQCLKTANTNPVKSLRSE